jgi:indole-3-glycerol phosphate synthase
VKAPTGPDSNRHSPGLKQALGGSAVAVIAEIKRRSPSKGELNPGISAASQAKAFEKGGAAAISVLTEPNHFNGTLQDLADAAQAVRLPLLRKDFHIDEAQLAEARHSSASAVLLIARALAPDHLRRMLRAADMLRLETVVEVRSEQELELAIDAGASIIGVNSRNLETLEVDERVPQRLMPLIPRGIIGIWESGVRTQDDVARAADCGADAVLVGSALSAAADPAALVATLASIPRQGRNG